jgi:Cdc6-like AAA superfamily ATPase
VNKTAIYEPAHYTQGEIETIDYIRDALTAEEFTGYCTGNVMKYLARWRHKGGVEDLAKARRYLVWAIEAAEREADEIAEADEIDEADEPAPEPEYAVFRGPRR